MQLARFGKTIRIIYQSFIFLKHLYTELKKVFDSELGLDIMAVKDDKMVPLKISQFHCYGGFIFKPVFIHFTV